MLTKILSHTKKPMKYIPYGRQDVTEDDINEVTKVLRSDYLTQGPRVEEFENKVANEVDAKYGVAVNSATSALHLACVALGLGEGDQLWTSPTTFVASANCGLYCGATVDFVDIDIETGLMCVKELENKLKKAKKESRLPKIVIPVHLSGASCDMKRIKKLADKYNFNIIEDASHAIGGKYEEEPIGNCKYSDVTVFSFHPVKIITTGEGGMAMTNSVELAEKIKSLRSHGITKNFEDFIRKDMGEWHYEQQDLGYNYRMNDIEAALGISQIKRLRDIVETRNKQREIYIEKLKCCKIEILKVPSNTYSSVHLVVARLKDATETRHKDIFKALRSAGIGVQLHYAPVHLQPYYRKAGFKTGQFKNAEEYAKTALSIPVYPGLTKKEQDYVCEKLKEVTN